MARTCAIRQFTVGMPHGRDTRARLHDWHAIRTHHEEFSIDRMIGCSIGDALPESCAMRSTSWLAPGSVWEGARAAAAARKQYGEDKFRPCGLDRSHDQQKSAENQDQIKSELARIEAGRDSSAAGTADG